MKKRARYSAIATALMLSGVMVAPTVLAQGAPSAAAPQAAQTAPALKPQDAGPPPTDAELGHFVDAAFQVQAISNQARPQFDAAKTSADREKIKQAAEAKMETAVENDHLTVKRYKQIFVAMQTNDGVRKKVQALVQKKQGK